MIKARFIGVFTGWRVWVADDPKEFVNSLENNEGKWLWVSVGQCRKRRWIKDGTPSNSNRPCAINCVISPEGEKILLSWATSEPEPDCSNCNGDGYTELFTSRDTCRCVLGMPDQGVEK